MNNTSKKDQIKEMLKATNRDLNLLIIIDKTTNRNGVKNTYKEFKKGNLKAVDELVYYSTKWRNQYK